MTKKELFKRLIEIADEVKKLSEECGRSIEITAQDYGNTSHDESIRVGELDDGFAEDISIWTDKDGWNFLICSDDGRTRFIDSIDDIEEFDMEGKS